MRSGSSWRLRQLAARRPSDDPEPECRCRRAAELVLHVNRDPKVAASRLSADYAGARVHA